MPEKDKKFEDLRIHTLDKEQCWDTIKSINKEMEKHIKVLSQQMRIIDRLQQKKERLELRLLELGYYVSKDY